MLHHPGKDALPQEGGSVFANWVEVRMMPNALQAAMEGMAACMKGKDVVAGIAMGAHKL